jgi:plastocyanin
MKQWRPQQLFSMCAVVCAMLFSAPGAVLAAEHVVSQKNKSFSAKKLKIKAGDTIKFVNDDSFAHNVFSLSSAKGFGSGQSRTVTFEKAGKVEVECAIHPEMRLDVEVE